MIPENLHQVLIEAPEPNTGRLMIMLHGLGDSIEGYRWLPEALNLPWLNYLLVNAPDSYYGGYSWYDFAGDISPGVSRSTRLLTKLLDAQLEQGYQARNIILGGFSQGCLMALETALRYPKLLGGIVGISGYVSDPEKLLREMSPTAKQQRILVTHGTSDPIIPISKVEPQIRQLQKAGLPIIWKAFEKAHGIAGEAEIKLIRAFISQGLEATN